MARALQIGPDDSVATLVEEAQAGEAVRLGTDAIVAGEAIPRGHKIAVRAIAPGSINETGAGRFFQGGRERFVFRALRAANRGDPAQMILRLIAVALFDLP